MDAQTQRERARIVVIVMVILLTVMGACGVIYKINKKLIQPGIMESTPNKEAK